MFFKKLSVIKESNIKQYQDEKQLEERRHEELLQRKENKHSSENKLMVYLDKITARLEKFLNKIPVYLDKITTRLEKFLNKKFYD